MLYDQDEFISIFDKSKGKLVQYSSSKSLTIDKVYETDGNHNQLQDPEYERYIDEDYHLLKDDVCNLIWKN